MFARGRAATSRGRPAVSSAARDAMAALRDSIGIAWVVFWAGWLLSATTAKRGSRAGLRRAPGLVPVIVAVVLLRVFKDNALTVHSDALMGVGAAMFVTGLLLAIWARLYLGRNWGMPMTLKDEPELVTSGPYRLVRHPIYSGILLAMLGTALATNLYWLILAAALTAYFVYCATVEEGLMLASFPASYPSYRARTKMLIPFLL